MSFPIVFAADKHYFPPIYVAIHSLLRHLDPKTEVEIYILTADEDKEQEEIFRQLSEHIHFIRVTMNKVKLNEELPYISRATYYRFLIPEFFQGVGNEKVLYLDADIIVRRDITELLHTPMGDSILAGVHNYNLREDDPDEYESRCKECSIPDLESYVNAGVLLIDVKKLRETGLYKQMMEDAEKHTYTYNDQDLLNKYCFGNIKNLDIKYNFMVSWLKEVDWLSKKVDIDVVQKAEEAVVIHYATKGKPWIYRGGAMADVWRKECKKCPQEARKKLINPFIKKSRQTLSPSQRVKDFGKYIVRKYIFGDFKKSSL